MDARMDYVKLSWHANNMETVQLEKERINEKWDACCKVWGTLGGKLDWNNVYDGRGNWLLTCDISGAMAGEFIKGYLNPLVDFEHITRLDYRYDLGTQLPDRAHDEVYENVRALNTRNRNVTRGHAREREKGAKRDGGGNRISVGSLQSDKYLAIYTKPRENTAVEFKMSGKPLKRMVYQLMIHCRNQNYKSQGYIAELFSRMATEASLHLEAIAGVNPVEMAAYVQEKASERTELQAGSEKHSIVASFSDMTRPAQLTLLDELNSLVYPALPDE